jgi:nucleoside-diphosphate-sugar epimerase
LATVLIFGASGAVGRFLAPQLALFGARVLAVSRDPPQQDDRANVRWIRGDLFDATLEIADAVDIVVSLGPLDAFARWYERRAPAGARRVVALSSMSAESKRVSPDRAERELAERLRDAEARLARAARARGAAWTILRPTLIYGDGRDRSLAPIARLARRWRVLPIPAGAAGLRQPVHAADLAGAVLAAIDCTAAAGRTYPVGGGERLRFDELLGRLRAAVPGFVLAVPVPLFALRLWGRLRRGAGAAGFGDAALRRLREPLVADNAAAERDLGYAPRAFDAAEVLPESTRKRSP